MKLVIFGLTVSSSWGNGHATLWRGLIRALGARGHQVVFFERDVPYYASHRDLTEVPGGQLLLYTNWEDVRGRAKEHLAGADVGIVTSYCPDALAATALVISADVGLRVFYDLDTPVTLSHLRAGKDVTYIGPGGLADFDLVLSYTGGAALDELKDQLRARRVAPLYGSVDPAVHRPVPPVEAYRADLSYLGTYAEDRQKTLEQLFIAPAKQLPEQKFLIGGALYPEAFPWTANIFFARHVAPAEHPGFFCSSRLTLNVTRQAMAQMGYCPSGRLFEAAACGTPIISDRWAGLEDFFEPNSEILVAESTDQVVSALQLPRDQLQRISTAARERTLAEHTAAQRALDLERALETAMDTEPAGPIEEHA